MNLIRRGYHKGQRGVPCYFHKVGVPPGLTTPFYDEQCPRCRQKLAEGKTTADAPSPGQLAMQHHKHLRRGWALAVATEGIAKREGTAAARAHRKLAVPA